MMERLNSDCRKKIRIIFAVSSVLATLSALAFLNNLVAIVNWWRAFAAAGGDTAGLPAHAPGCIGWLDWTAVDYSAVTTFIPLLGFVCLARAAFAMLRGRTMDPEDFPFFRGSDQLNVALGLFGTLWGIIVIGYFKLETVQMADLMQCLHTALFSTLMAVVWVFLLDRPLIRPYFLHLLRQTDLVRTEDGDLTAAVDRLVERLNAASEAFDRRQRTYEETFAKRQSEIDAAFTKRQSEQDAAFTKRQSEQDAAFTKRQSEQDAAFAKRETEYAEAFAKRQSEQDAEFAKRLAAQSELFSKGEESLSRLQTEIAARCEAHLAAYEREFEQRQKEYVEFFQRRIAELESRAGASETKLKAVLSALQG